jgi:lysozyme
MMPDSMQVSLRKLLIDHEGYKRMPYVDTVGKVTIGIGYNLTDRGLPDSWINSQYEEDVDYFYTQLNQDFSWYKNLNEARQIALIDMAFMGYKRFLGFEKMLAAFAQENYVVAANEIENSEWYDEVKDRGPQIKQIVLTGEIS